MDGSSAKLRGRIFVFPWLRTADTPRTRGAISDHWSGFQQGSRQKSGNQSANGRNTSRTYYAQAWRQKHCPSCPYRAEQFTQQLTFGPRLLSNVFAILKNYSRAR